MGGGAGWVGHLREERGNRKHKFQCYYSRMACRLLPYD